MANHPSAEKRHRQSVKRAARNQAVRSQVRTEVKKLRTLVGATDAEQARAALPKVASTLDKAAGKGVHGDRAPALFGGKLGGQVLGRLRAPAPQRVHDLAFGGGDLHDCYTRKDGGLLRL